MNNPRAFLGQVRLPGQTGLGHAFLAQVPIIGQNYGGRRYDSRRPAVSQESTLPPYDLTDEQLSDWEAQYGPAPQAYHDTREARAGRVTAPDEAPAVSERAAAQSAAGGPIAEVSEVEDAFVPEEPSMTPPPPEEEFAQRPGTPSSRVDVSYEDLVDSLCEISNRFDRDSSQYPSEVAQIERGRQGVLDNVPSYDRDRVEQAARDKCPKYRRLMDAIAAPIEVEIPTPYTPEAEDVTSFDPTPEARDEQAERLLYDPAANQIVTGDQPKPKPEAEPISVVNPSQIREQGTQPCPPKHTRIGGVCIPDQASGIPMDFGDDSGMTAANVPEITPGGTALQPGGDTFDPLKDVQMTGRYPVVNL